MFAGVRSLPPSPEHRVNPSGRVLTVPDDIAPQVDALGAAVSGGELRQQRYGPVFGDPRVLGVVRILFPDILFPADDDAVGVDVLDVGGRVPEAAAARIHHILIEKESFGEILLLPRGVERWTQNSNGLSLGIHRRGDAELIPPGTQVFEDAGFPLERMALAGRDVALPYDGADRVDVV